MAQEKNIAAATGIPRSMIAFRTLVALLLAAHGWARMLAGAVEPFGGFLEAQGFPMGILIAWAITLVEIVGTILMIVGSRLIPYLCICYAFIYSMGIIMVHAGEGWFVVGLGRNGMEYSVLLIGCLLMIGYSHAGPGLRAKIGLRGKELTGKDTDN